jgi:hypothetical protein
MGQSNRVPERWLDGGPCYIDDCGNTAEIYLPREFYCGKEKACILCRQSSKERYVCSKHDKKDKYGYGLRFICPNTIAITKNYYTQSLMPQSYGCHRRDDVYLYKIKSDYIMIEGIIVHRFRPVYANVYSREVSTTHVDDVDILYDLTLTAMLNLLLNNKDLYLSILPKDIIEIIKKYL